MFRKLQERAQANVRQATAGVLHPGEQVVASAMATLDRRAMAGALAGAGVFTVTSTDTRATGIPVAPTMLFALTTSRLLVFAVKNRKVENWSLLDGVDRGLIAAITADQPRLPVTSSEGRLTIQLRERTPLVVSARLKVAQQFAAAFNGTAG